MAIATQHDERQGVTAEMLLWRDVLNQAISDLQGRPNSARNVHEIQAARSWVGTKDFFTCCDLAGYSREATLKYFETVMNP
jgi:hypothetical protein